MYFNRDSVIFLDGNWLKASELVGDLFSQTLHYGNGVFEGIRAYQTPEGPHIFKAKEHFDRLHYSASKMFIEIPYKTEELVEIAYQLLKKNNLQNAYIRPLVYLGANMALTETKEVYVLMAAWEWGRYLGNDPLKVMISSYEKQSPKSVPVDAKICGHYTNSILATMEAKSKGFDEALILDAEGNIAEGPGANFFFEKDEVLYTPNLGNILPGITRATVMDYAKEMGYRVIEKVVKPEELMEADAAFFTGTATEIAGIKSIGGHEFKLDWEDTIAYSLFLMYRQRVVNNEFRDFTLV
ncbi:MAG: branched-chain amino acid transaminase [Cyclobacteriaceae bacterium]|nr:branched-chain amino acid transaminase [Cyclobacteriaceae bacterium]